MTRLGKGDAFSVAVTSVTTNSPVGMTPMITRTESIGVSDFHHDESLMLCAVNWSCRFGGMPMRSSSAPFTMIRRSTPTERSTGMGSPVHSYSITESLLEIAIAKMQ